MSDLCKEAVVYLIRLCTCTGNRNVIDIKRCLGKRINRSTHGRNIRLKGTEFLCNLFRLLYELLKSFCERGNRSYRVRNLAAVRYVIVHRLVKSLVLKVHRLNNIREHTFQMIVTVTVRIGSGKCKDTTVHLVHTNNGVLKTT